MNHPLQFIFGANEYFVEITVQSALKKHADAAIEIIDGQVNTISELRRTLTRVTESLQTVDFFLPKKCVWLRNTNLFTSTSPAVTEGGQHFIESWLAFLQKIPADTYLIISATNLDKRLRLFKSIQSIAHCTELETANQDIYLQALIQKLSRQFTIEITPDAFELLKQKLNKQARAIANEFEKLACFHRFQGTISRDCVLKNTPTLPNDEFFEPVEAFYEGNLNWYSKSLRNHYIIHKEVRSILTMLQNRNRLLLQLAYLNKQHTFPNCNKRALDALQKNYETCFGPMTDKNTFCLFSQNPWYLSRLKTIFPYEVLLQLPTAFSDAFDQLLLNPKHACSIMENLAHFAQSQLQFYSENRLTSPSQSSLLFLNN